MRILQVTPRYAPHTGGVETQVRELSEGLTGRGHDVVVLTADAGDGVPRRERRDGVRVVRHRSLAPGGAYHFAPGIARAVRRTDADVVHAHNVHSLPLPLASLSARVPVVATAYYHGASADGLRNVLWTLYRPVVAETLTNASAVTAVSEWEQSRLAADLGVRARVVPIGIHRDRFDARAPAGRDSPYLLCVARLEAYKGVQHVIKTLPALEGLDLLVAGEGPYRGALEAVARTVGVADRVTFLGDVDRDELPAYYAGAEVYLSLSEFESYGLTVAESLASGTPCVVRNATALREWTSRDDCVGVDSLDPSAIAAAVAAVRGRETDPESLPTWTDVVTQFERIYRSV